VVDIHKDTLKAIRVWEVDEEDPDKVENPLEGRAVVLNDKTVLLTSTGAATLTQGTAEPLLISANGRCSSAIEATRATFDGAQLNWSSPTVAQRAPLVLKRTDDELTTRAAQEVRRLR
jgi:hypothetical protein